MRGIHLNMLSPVRMNESKNSHRQETVDSLERLSTVNCVDDADSNEHTSNNRIDEIDRPNQSAIVTQWDIFFLSFSIVTHIIDIGADIAIAARYMLDDKTTYFIWTIAFIIFPTLANTLISFRMNDLDLRLSTMSPDENERKRVMRTATTAVAERKACCVLVLLFQLAPLLRYCDSLSYALKARNCRKRGDREGQRRYYLKMLKEDQDVALLRVFECFLEAAPQQILQLTILVIDYCKSPFQVIIQIISLCSSLVSMGWSMASYHRTIRLAQHNKPNISLIGTILQFLWHFCVTVSRILSISVLASISPYYTGLACGLHWMAMTSWLVAEPHGVADFCRDGKKAPFTPLTFMERVRSALFAAVLGTVYVFTYLNPSEGRTFVRHLFYYALCLIENAVAAVLWALYANKTPYLDNAKNCSEPAAVEPLARKWWKYELLITLCTVPFCLGILAMILYYMFFHPSTKHRSSPSAVAVDPS